MARLNVAVRTLLATGGNGSSPGVVVEPGPDGGAPVDGGPARATLTIVHLPRARLETRDPSGSTARHDVLLHPLDHPDRTATGIERIEVVVDGWRFEIDLELESRARLRERATRARGELAKGGPVELRAIIPGRVVTVDVAHGDAVEAGQRVLVVEAMKMQNELRAPRAGLITRLAVGAGQTVELGDVLLVID